MNDMSTVIGDNIRRIRKDRGYDSIEAFARALEWPWITVSRYERGKSTPSVERLYEIADVLKVDITELLEAGNGKAA